MCLYIKQNAKCMVAREDIVCYKVLFENPQGDFRSPFMWVPYDLTSKCEKVTMLVDSCGSVQCGYHTYVYEEDAERLADILMEHKDENEKNEKYVIARCLIPTGSEYYVGDVYTGYKEEIGENGELPEGYVSDYIIIEEIIG